MFKRIAKITTLLYHSGRSTSKNSSYYFSIQESKKMQKSNQVGFVIDIDGTILHGDKPFPEGQQTLDYLVEKKIPFLLLTNNCAPSEKWKANNVSQILNLKQELKEQQVVLNYTPVKERFKDVGDGVVLVVGRDKRLEEVLPLPHMEKYITVPQYCSVFPQAVPLSAQYTPQAKAQVVDRLKKRLNLQKLDKYELKVSGIVILTVPLNWQQSIQVIIDLLSTPSGQVSTHHSFQHQQTHIPVMTCYSDMYMVSTHNLPRMLMKPFLQSLKTVYQLVYSNELKIDIYGKPHPNSYNFAKKQLEDVYGPVGKLVMVGDNVEADILGPAQLGWHTILVKTGVTKTGHHIATVNAQNIWEGVKTYLDSKQPF